MIIYKGIRLLSKTDLLVAMHKEFAYLIYEKEIKTAQGYGCFTDSMSLLTVDPGLGENEERKSSRTF